MSASSSNNYDGFLNLQQQLESYLTKLNNPLDIIEPGVVEFVKDLLKLPKPKSVIVRSGYTHLIDTFCYEKKDKEIEVGWGKYYGRMVEQGTKRTKRQPHLNTTFERNKEKYYQIMINKSQEN